MRQKIDEGGDIWFSPGPLETGPVAEWSKALAC